jgi:hypothetical protein
MSKESFTPQEKETIKNILRGIAEYRDHQAYGMVIVEVCKFMGSNPIPQIEALLREMESNTYLIAIPPSPEILKHFALKMPHSGDEEYPYQLWIGVNGYEEAEAMMREVGTTPEQNMINLGRTGILMLRPGSDASKAMKAHLN